MLKFVHAAIVGLIGAAIVHGAAIMLLPTVSGNSILERLRAAMGEYEFKPFDLSIQGQDASAVTDPYLRSAVCRFSLAEAPVRITAAGRVPFWSVSVFDASGVNLYSYNDRLADGASLDLVVASPLQMIALRKAADLDGVQSISLETNAAEVAVLLHVLLLDESWTDLVNGYLATAKCEPVRMAGENTDADRQTPSS